MGEDSPDTTETTSFLSMTPSSSSRKGEENLNTWADGNEQSDSQIDYIDVSNENREWVTNAQTKGVDNPSSPLQHETIQIHIKYDIIWSGNKIMTANT